MTESANRNQSTDAKAFDEISISLTSEFLLAALDDGSVLDGLPNGSMLILLPENNPDFVEQSIEIGLNALRQGQDVVFRHVQRGVAAPIP